MTLTELKGKYARLRDEIDSLGGAQEHSEARLARMMGDLDRIDQELAVFRRRSQAAPVLQEVVAFADPVRAGKGSSALRPSTG
jgi:hypothetical protein